MNIEEAITTAIEYETKVRDVYIDAMKRVQDEAGKKIFNTMAKEEQGHLDYLDDRLRKWQETGKLDAPKLKSIVPSKEAVEEGIRKLESKLDDQNRKRDTQYRRYLSRQPPNVVDTPEAVAERLGEYVALGIDHFVLRFNFGEEIRKMRLFMD